MVAAVILICTTLVTNAASGTDVAQVCPSDAQVEVAELTNSFDNFSFNVIDDFIEPAESMPGEANKASVAPTVQVKAKPVIAQRIVRSRHVRVAFNWPRHHHKSWHKAHVLPTGVAEVRPDAPPSLWDSLKKLPLLNLVQNGD